MIYKILQQGERVMEESDISKLWSSTGGPLFSLCQSPNSIEHYIYILPQLETLLFCNKWLLIYSFLLATK